MIDFAPLLVAERGQAARTLHLVDTAGFDGWASTQSERTRAHLSAARFKGAADGVVIVPGDASGDWSAVVGVKSADTLGPWCLARAAETLPEGTYKLATGTPSAAAGPRILLTDAPAAIGDVLAEARATALVRDMVNTPASDMGPAEIEAAAADVAKAHGATVTVTRGAELESGYPMIHAVGMAAARGREPRLIELSWGDPAHPRVAIVGKGVSFDTGGLDIKPSSGMRLMKKDMGGAAHALALAELVMGARLPVRLHLLIPAVENAIAGNAFRPGDIIASRQGLSVEIANTDAEGRLILGDALTRAGEENPGLIVDFATLTGAARVALGPDLPATFTNDDALADDAIAAGVAIADRCGACRCTPGMTRCSSPTSQTSTTRPTAVSPGR
jgi:leucyl aminopeptidase